MHKDQGCRVNGNLREFQWESPQIPIWDENGNSQMWESVVFSVVFCGIMWDFLWVSVGFPVGFCDILWELPHKSCENGMGMGIEFLFPRQP